MARAPGTAPRLDGLTIRSWKEDRQESERRWKPGGTGLDWIGLDWIASNRGRGHWSRQTPDFQTERAMEQGRRRWMQMQLTQVIIARTRIFACSCLALPYLALPYFALSGWTCQTQEWCLSFSAVPSAVRAMVPLRALPSAPFSTLASAATRV